MTADAHHITQPAEGGEGGARAMRAAIKQAGVCPEDMDYLNAHGTSTPMNDKFETQAIKIGLRRTCLFDADIVDQVNGRPSARRGRCPRSLRLRSDDSERAHPADHQLQRGQIQIAISITRRTPRGGLKWRRCSATHSASAAITRPPYSAGIR